MPRFLQRPWKCAVRADANRAGRRSIPCRHAVRKASCAGLQRQAQGIGQVADGAIGTGQHQQRQHGLLAVAGTQARPQRVVHIAVAMQRVTQADQVGFLGQPAGIAGAAARRATARPRWLGLCADGALRRTAGADAAAQCLGAALGERYRGGRGSAMRRSRVLPGLRRRGGGRACVGMVARAAICAAQRAHAARMPPGLPAETTTPRNTACSGALKEILVDRRRIELPTSALRTQRSPS